MTTNQPKLVDKKYVISTKDMQTCYGRLPVRIIDKGNMKKILEGTKIYEKNNGDEELIKSTQALRYDNPIMGIVHQQFDTWKTNGAFDNDWDTYLFSPDGDHGGIPCTTDSSIVYMDYVCMMINKNYKNIESQRDGDESNKKNWHPNTIYGDRIHEKDLVCVELPVLYKDEKKKKLVLRKRQMLFATCRQVLASKPMSKKIEAWFYPIAHYLQMPNYSVFLTENDTNKFVQAASKSDKFKSWNNGKKLNLTNEMIEKMQKERGEVISPIFKLIAVEKINDKNAMIFSPISGRLQKQRDFDWANYSVSRGPTQREGPQREGGSCKMCVAAIGAVADDGISPVRFQKDPPVHIGKIENEITGGCVIYTYSGFKRTTKNLHNNLDYSLQKFNGDDYYSFGKEEMLTEKEKRIYDFMDENSKTMELFTKAVENNVDVNKLDEILETKKKMNKELENIIVKKRKI